RRSPSRMRRASCPGFWRRVRTVLPQSSAIPSRERSHRMRKTGAEIDAALDEPQPNHVNKRNKAAAGVQRLQVVLPEPAAAAPKEATQTILKQIKPLSDTGDLGDPEFANPGPMVNELQRLGGLEAQRIGPVARWPTPLPLWMVNRLMHALANAR